MNITNSLELKKNVTLIVNRPNEKDNSSNLISEEVPSTIFSIIQSYLDNAMFWVERISEAEKEKKIIFHVTSGLTTTFH